ncbi:MAG: SDR family NAD(P)-dependent oxidoreductase [Pseudomonadota bacterium]
MDRILTSGRTAVITGGADGIGAACAKAFAGYGMNVVVVDRNEEMLAATRAELEAIDGAGTIRALSVDVADLAAVESLRDQIREEFGEVGVLMNNAGIGAGGKAWSNIDGWRQVIETNLWGIVNGVHTFVPFMLEQGQPGAIVNTGSKQGLTNPPGNVAYNVAKAGVRTLTEALAHELREAGAELTAHLLIPGFTYTGLMRRHIPEKPPGAWLPEQVADFLLEALENGDFYVLCPDNDVPNELDHRRLQWNTTDIVANRPALSRWHPDYADAFAAFVEDS